MNDAMTPSEIRTAVDKLRLAAETVGGMHSNWDLIFDAEALLAGKQTLLSRDVIERELRKAIS